MELISLQKLYKNEYEEYKQEMKKCFFKSQLDLHTENVDVALKKKHIHPYKAIVNGVMAGGIVVTVDGTHGFIDFFFVDHLMQSIGVGKKMWEIILNKYPKVTLWDVYTPYIRPRNLHFYVNKLGFEIVEFFNPHHPDPNPSIGLTGNELVVKLELRLGENTRG